MSMINNVDCPHFILHEFECSCGCGLSNPNPRLLRRTNKARKISGIPWHLTSGSRCLTHNRSIGSKDTSSHVPKGDDGYTDAIDVDSPDSRTRWEVVHAMVQAGFTRIGIGKSFVHGDVDVYKSQNVMWDYYKK